MLGPHSQLPIRAAALRLFAAMAFVAFAGCAATPPQQAAAGEEAQEESDADAPAGDAQALAPEAVDRTALPNQELTENLLYEFLLAESHLAVARAAVNAGDERVALEEARRAGQLRPDWEAPALLEAQLLQKASVDQAATLLAGYLKKYPAARETRLAYARLLVAQKRFGEARDEFQKLMAGVPESSDAAFAVALLSLQLKDYDAAEKYLRSLIESPYRDKDGVRLYLGQVAEERKNLPEALRW